MPPTADLPWDAAGTLFLVQILAAMRAQALAIFAAGDLQRQRQQHLLAQNIFQQNSVALIIADLGFGVGHREFVAAGVRAERPVEQFEVAGNVLLHRFQTAGALQLDARRQTPSQAYVLDYLCLP